MWTVEKKIFKERGPVKQEEVWSMKEGHKSIFKRQTFRNTQS